MIELRPHQEEAIQSLELLRAEGKTIALVTHAQGAGKTVTAITDARRLGGRVLFVAHTRELVMQARAQFLRLWPDVSTGLFLDEERETEEYNLVGTVQSLSRHMSRFTPEDFTYLIIDEAHHATADTYQKLLRFLRPIFLLGLTATAVRADGLSALRSVSVTRRHRLVFAGGCRIGRVGPDPLCSCADECRPKPRAV